MARARNSALSAIAITTLARALVISRTAMYQPPPFTAAQARVPSGCFGGVGHVAERNIAKYGHAGGFNSFNCREPVRSRAAVDDGETQAAPELKLISRGKGGETQTLRWLGNETALIIIDMWHYHPCKTITNRAGALVPRMNAVAAGLRKARGHVIFAPTEAAESFSGWPQREAVLAEPLLLVPPYTKPVYNFSDRQGVFGQDDMCSFGGHDCV
eukprot:SAG31_NODE_6260_length_2098_cov_25.272136_1_plen_214_part_00